MVRLGKTSAPVWRSDAIAGATSAMVALPVAIGGGILASASLGPDFTTFGVRAGLICAVVAAMVTAIFGSSRFSIAGPSAATSIVLAGGLASMTMGTTPAPVQVALLMLLIVALSGVILVVAGAQRYGSFIKFIPRPVLAGFVNGIALLVAYSQIGAALGLEGALRWEGEFFSDTRYGAVFVCVLTVVVCLRAGKMKLPIPSQFAGLACGFGIHYLIQAVNAQWVGRTVGELPGILGTPEWLASLSTLSPGDLPWTQILAAALLLAIMGAVQTLMTAVAIDSLAHTRHDANRELIGFGLGNIASALCGGIASSANMGRAMSNFRAGATSRASAGINGLAMLIVVALASPLLAAVPMAVMAGILIHSSMVLVDAWSIEQLRRWYVGHERGEVHENVIVVAVMTVGMLWMSPVVAVAVGVILTMGLFLKRMSQSFVRRTYSCEAKRSLKVRPRHVELRLQVEGKRIHVIELEGALFFGTADRLRHLVESHHRDAAVVILDCRRVREWDATGVQIIGQLFYSLQRTDRRLFISHVSGRMRIEPLLRAYGFYEHIPEENTFPDTDRALECAEDVVLALASVPEERAGWERAMLQSTLLLRDMSEDEQVSLSNYFDTLTLPEGANLFRAGDLGDRLFVLLEGEVTLGLPVDGRAELRRLFTITPGVVFGEMALLDSQPRSANAYVQRDAVLKAISRSDFQRLRDEQPSIFAKLLQNIAHEMSLRLRTTNHQLRALEE